jgi:hypothetical protein
VRESEYKGYLVLSLNKMMIMKIMMIMMIMKIHLFTFSYAKIMNKNQD